jgi:hypothetical protein
VANCITSADALHAQGMAYVRFALQARRCTGSPR